MNYVFQLISFNIKRFLGAVGKCVDGVNGFLNWIPPL